MPAAMKRPASAVATEPVVVKAKKPTVDPLMAGVLDGLTKAEGLPEMCREMLVKSIPHSLMVLADERHEHQEVVIKMIDQVFTGIQAKMQQAVDTEAAKTTEADKTKEGHEAAVASATAALEARAGELTAKKSARDEASQAVVEGKTKVEEALAAQKSGDAHLKQAEGDKAKIEQVIAEHVNPFKAEGGKEHSTSITAIAKQLKLDESLIIALPAVFDKAVGERSSFDQMVIDQLDASLGGLVKSLSETLSSGAAASAERAAAVEAAEKSLSDLGERQSQAVAEVGAAEEAHSEAVKALAAAEAASAEFLKEYATLVKDREKMVFELDNFRDYNVACFTELRGKTGKKDEPAAEEAPAAAEGAEAAPSN